MAEPKPRPGANQHRFRPDTVPPPYSPITVESPILVKQSYDHEASANDQNQGMQKAILDMLRAIYQQQEEHMAWMKLRPDDSRRDKTP